MAKQIKLVISTSTGTNAVTYRENKIYSLSTHRALYDNEPSIGNCVSGELNAVLDLDTSVIPRNAKIVPYVSDDGTTWIKKSEYYLFSRSVDKATGALTVVAYDAIYRSELDYYTTSGDQGYWPKTTLAVMQEIALRIGANICSASQTLLNNPSYYVQYPGYGDGALSMRQVAGDIAVRYAGNWVIDNNGELHLIRLADIPAETNYLITENNYVITLGGVRLIV